MRCQSQASFVGAMAVADLVKSTLGPKGMDKILQSMGRGETITVTNDGATILKSLYVDNAAAKVLVGELRPSPLSFHTSAGRLLCMLAVEGPPSLSPF